MKLSKIAKNLTSVGMLALIAASITLGVAQFAYAQDKVLNAKKGKSVILRVGEGFSKLSALGIKEVLDAEGCPTTVTSEPYTLPSGKQIVFKNRLLVQVGDRKPHPFKSVGSAGASALEECTSGISSKKKTGGHVILRVGKGYSTVSAAKVAADLPEQCTHEITTERGFPKHLTVQVDKKINRFRNSGEAGLAAEDWCLESLKK